MFLCRGKDVISLLMWTVIVKAASRGNRRWGASAFMSIQAPITKKMPWTATTSRMFSSKEQQDNMIQYQSVASSSKAENDNDATKGASPIVSEEEHLRHQQDVFDSISEWFADREKEVTPELEPIYQAMAEDILLRMRAALPANESDESSNTLHILDVACGTGVLWEFLMEAANQANLSLHITGVDLSPSMVDYASNRAQQVLKDNDDDKQKQDHSIQIVASDIQSFCQTADPRAYDGIILNACFGNFWDPKAVLESLPGPSVIAVSHPLGASFVQQLHDEDPKMVPHTLPSSTLDMVQEWTFGLPIIPTYYKASPYYLMTLDKQRRRAKPLTDIQRYRGTVDQGYGRGGKKLGVPTANLPASLFQNALADVPMGVYFGWAVLEHIPQRVFKAVVNVGYSPTFEGQENKEKIIEAHLIITKQQEDKKETDYAGSNENETSSTYMLQDFYGQTMRLQLCGYLRDEQKFDSFPALVAQIQADIDDAREALELSPFADWKTMDSFLQVDSSSNDPWVGQGGGNAEASWEFVDQLKSIKNMVNK